MHKVALFSTQFLPYSQTFVYDEICAHERYHVDVFSRVRRNEQIFAYPEVHALLPANSLRGKIRGLIYSITTCNKDYLKKIQKNEYALIHAHFGPGSVYALRYQKKTGLPLVVTFHGYDVPLLLSPRRFWPRHWRYWFASKKMFRNTSLFLAASEELAGMLIRLGAPEERVRVWRLGIPIPKQCKGDLRQGNRVLMIGRFVEKKGFAYGIRAFAEVCRDNPDLELHIVGSGKKRKQLEKTVRQCNIASKVRFAGVLTQSEVIAELSRADLLIAPSVVASNGDRESGLLVAKEAAAMGLPVIGTRHGGIPSIIDDGKTGFLVPERDYGAIAEKLSILLEDSSLRRSMGAAARKKMEQEYDIRERVRKLEEYYDSLLH